MDEDPKIAAESVLLGSMAFELAALARLRRIETRLRSPNVSEAWRESAENLELSPEDITESLQELNHVERYLRLIHEQMRSEKKPPRP